MEGGRKTETDETTTTTSSSTTPASVVNYAPHTPHETSSGCSTPHTHLSLGGRAQQARGRGSQLPREHSGTSLWGDQPRVSRTCVAMGGTKKIRACHVPPPLNTTKSSRGAQTCNVPRIQTACWKMGPHEMVQTLAWRACHALCLHGHCGTLARERVLHEACAPVVGLRPSAPLEQRPHDQVPNRHRRTDRLAPKRHKAHLHRCALPLGQ